MKIHDQEMRRVYWKLHLTVDADTHEIICADLSLNNVTDAKAFGGLSVRRTGKSGLPVPTVLMTQNGATTSCCAKKLRRLSRRERTPANAGGVCRQKSGGARQRLTKAMHTENGTRLTTDVWWLKRQCTVSNSYWWASYVAGL